MHIFIDTNILLSFFHFSKDDLDALNDVFGTHDRGSAIVYLTEQVSHEFKRNREVKIKDALKRFENVSYTAQLPYFMKAYEEHDGILNLCSELKQRQKEILEKVYRDILDENLLADRLIGDIFKRSRLLKTTLTIYEAAQMRMKIGNPPGKNKSIGDAINWELLLESVPEGEELHIISADGDFFSKLFPKLPHPFLLDEWKLKKKTNLHTYRSLSEFLKDHFDGVEISYDEHKEALIERLRYTVNFSSTHMVVSNLESFPYFSLIEVSSILDAAVENSQFGWIVTDDDVSDFLNRVAVPHMGRLSNEMHLEVLNKVIEEQNERSHSE